ncbi:hypothetical protein M422DRAFT_209501 [Sphaerobolus stellatus SS14]|uniref:DM2 domain-containing protein n=1 Tax=Sphaerobolus stellatus (strain SS14) TaxID=990650 RepID=A0A0C9UD74_SPHS4|nr:hypothetical protein M422DRAFT_209501 [Sphaerobolus stellatus SS14]
MAAPVPANMEAPKNAKRRKLTDRSIPTSLLNSFEDSQLYFNLLEAERKLDWTIARKRMEIQDSYGKPSLVTRTLRVFLSHTVEGQPWQTADGMSLDPTNIDFSSGSGIPSWTFKIEGRLLSNHQQLEPKYASRIPNRKFTHYLKGMVVEFDQDPTVYPEGNIVEWRNTSAHPEQDGFEIKRKGDVSVMARVILHLKVTPDRFKLIEPLAEILDMKEDTRHGIITALWHYIKVNGLQDKVDRKIIRPDAKLRPIIGLEQITFQQLPEIINRCLKPMDPVIIPYVITVDPSTPAGMQAFDVEIPVDDIILKSKMSVIHSQSTEIVKQVATIDEELAIAAQSIRNSKLKLDFLKSLSSDPASFVQTWLSSQSRDLDIILGNEQGVKEEDLKNSRFFDQPWVDEAVSVQEGLRVTNALRAQGGALV